MQGRELKAGFSSYSTGGRTVGDTASDDAATTIRHAVFGDVDDTHEWASDSEAMASWSDRNGSSESSEQPSSVVRLAPPGDPQLVRFVAGGLRSR